MTSARSTPNSEGRAFTLGEVLSITTGKLLCPIDQVYEILNYMTDDSLYTHQLPRVSEECRPYLLKQHPDLADVDASSVNTENWQAWLRETVEKYGPTRMVAKLPKGDHHYIDPLSELAEKVHPDKIITVQG